MLCRIPHYVRNDRVRIYIAEEERGAGEARTPLLLLSIGQVVIPNEAERNEESYQPVVLYSKRSLMA